METKFKDFKYSRPDINSTVERFNLLLSEFREAKNAADQYEVLKRINELRSDFSTMSTICSVRYTINTEDEYYAGEHDYFDEIGPEYGVLLNELYHSLLKSKYREELEIICGKQLFNLAEISVKTFNPGIVEDLKKENQLVSKYVKLIASAKINFEGKERNIAGMAPFMQSENREVRKNAHDAKLSFFEKNETELDSIYDDLVKVRNTIAKKLGYKNFVQLGYDRMRRSGYTISDVANFRDSVKEHLVPLSITLNDLKKKRTGLEHLYYYDSGIVFSNGNPTPKGSPEWITEKAKKMYEELYDRP